jgi:glycosyltransferase involved in cell wall biosynthesis
MQAMPRVTVLMAVRDGERTVGEAVESILRQTFTDFEFLVVDDASTDGTAAVLASFRDERLTVLENERPQGLTRSLNRGLSRARGNYIARQDADDRSAPERLARQVDVLDAQPDVALVGTWYRKIDESGRVLGSQRLPTSSTELRWDLIFYSPFVHSSVMIRSAALEAVGNYDESLVYAQDYDLWCRLAKRLALANVAEYLVDYRASPVSMTETLGETVIAEPRQIGDAYLNDVYRDLPRSNDPPIETISALLFRPHLLDPSDDTAASARAALRHHDAFSDYFALPETERAASRASLARRLRRRLCRLALAEGRRGHPRHAVRLLAAAASVASEPRPR